MLSTEKKTEVVYSVHGTFFRLFNLIIFNFFVEIEVTGYGYCINPIRRNVTV